MGQWVTFSPDEISQGPSVSPPLLPLGECGSWRFGVLVRVPDSLSERRPIFTGRSGPISSSPLSPPRRRRCAQISESHPYVFVFVAIVTLPPFLLGVPVTAWVVTELGPELRCPQWSLPLEGKRMDLCGRVKVGIKRKSMKTFANPGSPAPPPARGVGPCRRVPLSPACTSAPYASVRVCPMVWRVHGA